MIDASGYTPATIGPLLDSAVLDLRRLQEEGPKMVMPCLSSGLDNVRRNLNDVRLWNQFCTDVLHTHAVHDIFLEDPFTKHASAQPRGYPGDADLLDYIYDHKKINGASRLGKALFEYTTNVQSSAAVRERRSIVARLIDRTAEQVSSPRLFSLAAGHLREAALSGAIKSGAIAEFVAFDQDPYSLSIIDRDYGKCNVVTQHGSVRSLIASKHSFSKFNLVYAAGLFDYLAERTAARLTRVMFDMLAPGGRLLIANFAPTLCDIGYMEAFMRWHLIYRNNADMAGLAAEISPPDIATSNVYWNSTNCMLFLELERA